MAIEKIIEDGANLNHLNESDEYYLHSIHYEEFTKFPIATREVSEEEANTLANEMLYSGNFSGANEAIEAAFNTTYISISNN